MSEQQEIKMTGCKVCGKEIDEFPNDSKEEHCNRCYSKIERVNYDYRLTQTVISKLIYGEVSKSDLKLFHDLMFFTKQKPFASFELNQSELAKEFDMQQSNISRSLKKLIKANLLIKNDETNLYTFAISKIT